MKYELIVTISQPTCGGQAPTRSDIKYVETDDPVAYVQEQEKAAKLEVSYPGNGVVVVEYATGSGNMAKYEFTPDD